MASSIRKIKGLKSWFEELIASLEIVEVLDLAGAQSQIIPKVLLVYVMCSYYHYSIQELGTHEMNKALNKLCVNGILKLEHQHLEAKGLMHILHMPRDFQSKWIRFILSRVHNGKLWLEKPILITRKMIHRITSLPMLDKSKLTKALG